jgi:hypothetical protein
MHLMDPASPTPGRPFRDALIGVKLQMEGLKLPAEWARGVSREDATFTFLPDMNRMNARRVNYFGLGGIMEIDKDEQLDRALMRVDPARKWSLAPDLIHGLVTEFQASEAVPGGTGNRINRAWIALALAGAVAIGGVGAAVPAAADFFSFLTRTGEMPGTHSSAAGIPTAYTEVIPGSELIRPLASDYAKFAKTKYGSLPIPEGLEEDRFKTDVANNEAESYQRNSQGLDVITQDIAPTLRYEIVVRCLWLREWSEGYSAADEGARSAAVGVLKQSLSWPATVATDGGGVVEHMTTVVAAAESGDVEAVRTGYGVWGCSDLLRELDQ